MRLSSLVWICIILISHTTLLLAQSDFRYSYIPKSLYPNQLFAVTIVSSGEKNSQPVFGFDTQNTLQPISTKPLIVRNGNDRFYTFYFKAEGYSIKTPQIDIQTKDQHKYLRAKTIPIKDLENPDNFSKVIAVDMKIKNSQISNYDEHNHIITLSIEAIEANIEDMRVDNIDSGVENINRKFAKVVADFYIIVPIEEKVFKFSYFNSIKKRFIYFQLPIVLSDSSTFVQSDLSPTANSFEILKRYSFIFFSIFFLIMFLAKRDFLYLLLFVISLITLLTFYIPHKSICIKQGTKIYILPTHTSTMTSTVTEDINTSLLETHAKFLKIEYKKGIIGWIKDEDTCKN